MTICDIQSERLSALVDGELSPADELAVRGHLAGCPRCTQRLAALDAVHRAVAAVAPGDADAEAEATDAHLADLRRRLAGPRVGRAARSTAAALAAALALAVILWTVDRPRPRVAPETTAAVPSPASIDGIDGIDGIDATDPLLAGDSPCGSPETCGPSARPLALDPDF